MGYFDDLKAFFLRKLTSDQPVDADQEYTRHRNEAEFQHSPTGRLLAEMNRGSLTNPALQRQEGQEETLAPTTQANQAEKNPQPIQTQQITPKPEGEGPVKSVMRPIGKAGKALANAIHPGIVTGARAIGLDEDQAESVATAFTEVFGGLPGPEAVDDAEAGVYTALAGLPLAHGISKGLRLAVAKIPDLAANAERISEELLSHIEPHVQQFLQDERGSMYGKELTKPLAEIVNPPKPEIVTAPDTGEQYQNIGRLQTHEQGVPEIPVFYSPTERVIETKLPNAATPEQVMGTLQGAGIPMEEAKWMDIEGFMRGKKSVSKQELLDYVRSHRIQLEEVPLGEPTPEAKARIRQLDSEIRELEKQHRAYVEQKRAEHEAAEDARIAEAQAKGEDPLPEGAKLFDTFEAYADNLEKYDKAAYNDLVYDAKEEARDISRSNFEARLANYWNRELIDDEFNHDYRFEFEDYTVIGNDERSDWFLRGPGGINESFSSLDEAKQRIAELVAADRRAEDGIDETTRQLTLEGGEEGARVPIDVGDDRYNVDAILENELDYEAEDLGIPEDNQAYRIYNSLTGSEIIGSNDTGWIYRGDLYDTLEDAEQAVYDYEWDHSDLTYDEDTFKKALKDALDRYRARLQNGQESLPDNIYVRGINAPENGLIRRPFVEPKNDQLDNLKALRNELQTNIENPTQYEEYRLPGGQNYREFLLKIPNIDYRAKHFGEHADDLVIHFRVSERFVDDPAHPGQKKRVLVVEEIQSDLNQIGRKHGFRDLEKVAQLEKEAEAAREEWRFWTDKYKAAAKDSDEAKAASKKAQEALDRYQVLLLKVKSAKTAPPLTPLAKSWPELAIKRILRLAAEEGYDTIAWTTGEQQGKRYAGLLVENVETVKWTRNPNGTYTIDFFLNDGRHVTALPGEDLSALSPESLRDLVGADITNSIVNNPDSTGVIGGQDLTVGALGMKGFYDDILVKSVNKYVKKWNGKVDQIDLGRDAWDEAKYGKAVLHSVDITPEMAEAVLNNPQSLLGSAFQTIEDHLRLLPKMIQQELREKLPAPKTWKKLEEEGGYFALGPSMFLARTIIGALAGTVVGDEENAIRNALIGAGLGAIASPALVGKLVGWARTAKAAKAQPPVFRPTTDFKAFLDARSKVERQEYLTPLTEQDLAGIVANGGKVMLSQDGMTGYILTAEGDLQSVFNSGPAGMGKYAVKDAVKRGAKTLDAFDGFLPNYYRQFGFLETGRVPFDPNLAAPGVEQALGGRPDVVFMAQATPLHEYQAMYRRLVDAARDGVRRDPTVKLEGDLLVDYGVINEESIKKLYPGSTMNDAQIYALHRVLTESGKKVLELAQNVTDDATLQEFLKAFYTHGMLLDPKRLGIEAEAGRSLRMFGTEAPVDVQGMKRFLDQFSGVLGSAKEGMSPLRLVDMVKAFKTPEQMAVFAKNAVKPGLEHAILNLWVNSLLSGPHTHVANALGNGTALAWTIAERQVAGLMGGEVRPSEAMAMVIGIFESFADALRLGWEIVTRSDDVAMFAGKVEQRTRVSFEDVGLTGVPGRALDYLSAFFEGMGGRTLLATDEFFKAIAFRAEVRARALREAYNVVNAEGLTGAAARQRVNELVEKYITDVPEDIQKEAEKFAAYVTFTKSLGPTGQWLADGSANHPVVKLILPFVRAPINIFKFAGERTPLALLHKSFWNEIQAGGARAELALSKISVGAMIAGLGVLWASKGIITGGGPQNKKLKDLKAVMQEGGWQPYAINVSALKRMAKGQSTEWQKGDQFVSYNRVEPLGLLFGLYANYADIVANKETDETWDEVASNLVMGTVKAMSSKTFIKGLSQTAMAFMFPDEFLGDTLNKLAVSFVPILGSSLSREVAQQVDPVLREAEGFIQELMKNTPGLSRTLPPTLHPISGEPVYWQRALGPDFASPLYQSFYKKDRVIEELVKQKVAVHPPSKVLFGVPLSQEGYVELQRIITHDVKLGGRNLHDALEHLMDSPVYKSGQDGPEGRKALLLRSMIARFHEAGKVKMLKKYPELKQAVRDFYKERAAKLKSIPLPPSDDAIENADVDLDEIEVAGH